jgi:signal transduction histidine kinase/DNA-binding response OmpR family regulator/CHASE3 domain sensor protein
MSGRGLTFRMVVASAVLLLVVASVFATLFLTARDLRSSSQAAKRAEKVTAAANLLERLVIDVQTGPRGFVITQDERFLEPWTEARASIPRQVARLRALIIDEEQLSRLADIDQDIRSYITEYGEPLVDTARTDSEAARAIVAGGEGKRRIDALRAEFAAFLQRQDKIGAAREARSDSFTRRSLVLTAGGLAGSLILILLFTGYLARIIVLPVRRVSAAAERLAAGDMSVRVPENGYGELRALGTAFNRMAESVHERTAQVEAANTELESQNVELEYQQVELEEQQERLATSNDELARQAALNRAVLDSTRDGIAFIEPDGSVSLTNKALDRMAADFLKIPTRGAMQDAAASVADNTTDPEGFRTEIDKWAADPGYVGEAEYQMLSGEAIRRYTAPVRASDGSILGRISVLSDITAEREAERLKDELMATVSHELRTPLASILGFAELLITRELDEKTRTRYLATIHREAARLTALINDFLDLQRMEEGGFKLALEPFELGQLVRHEAEVFSGQSAEHSVEVDVPDDQLNVVGEPERVAQVLANLLSNAIKYSPAGGTVRVAAESRGSFVRVSVSDEGLGIPRDQQRHIFTKFFRVDSSDTRRIGGTGLGLALCREIIETHGGRIGFESAVGQGSTFWLELPAGSSAQADGRPRLLVIEDDADAAALLEDHLGQDGYAVELAASGEEGLRRVRSGTPPALICLDIRLAGEVDGWGVLASLKEAADTAGIPVLVCTAYGGRENAAVLGASDFLSKPFTAKQLRETVERLLPAGGRSVLVVDDEEPVRRLVVETLGGFGLELREAADGEEALERIAAALPDAIVLDLVMPKLDGFAVLERLQEGAETRTIPVVVLTAKALSPAERVWLRTRALSVLEKSEYSAHELRKLVVNTVGGG